MPYLHALHLQLVEPTPFQNKQKHRKSTEIVEKLTKIKPKNLSQASRIDGVTPAALSVILSYIKTKAKSQKLA